MPQISHGPHPSVALSEFPRSVSITTCHPDQKPGLYAPRLPLSHLPIPTQSNHPSPSPALTIWPRLTSPASFFFDDSHLIGTMLCVYFLRCTWLYISPRPLWILLSLPWRLFLPSPCSQSTIFTSFFLQIPAWKGLQKSLWPPYPPSILDSLSLMDSITLYTSSSWVLS